jgi:hypothetical protein
MAARSATSTGKHLRPSETVVEVAQGPSVPLLEQFSNPVVQAAVDKLYRRFFN